MNDKRLFLSLSQEDLDRLDVRRRELGMNRSQYIRYLLSGQRKAIPFSIRQKELVEQFSQIDLHLRSLCLKQGLKDDDVLYILESIKDMRKALEGSSRNMEQVG